MKVFAATAAAVALLGQSAWAQIQASEFDRVELEANATTTSAPSVEVGDDDGSDLISPLLPGSDVSLLADAPAHSAPWSFQLTADDRYNRELVAALSPLPTTKECPIFARDACSVLVAVSSCFTKKTFKQIKDWVEDLGKSEIRYFPGDANAVSYEIRWVEDGCGCPQWSSGLEQLTGRSTKDYIGVISVTVYATAAKTVAQYIAGKNLPPPIGYVYNGPVTINRDSVVEGSNKITTQYEGYQTVAWNEIDKGFMCRTDLLDNLRKVHCSKLVGSKANLFVSNGKRSCFCACADGYEFVGDVCKPKPKDEDCTCAWSSKTNGYRFDISTPGTVCSVPNDGRLPVPIIGDNYVDRYRANNGDIIKPLTTPRIALTKQRVGVALTGSSKSSEDAQPIESTAYTWTSFRNAANSPVSQLQFNSFGKYQIELQAFDYESNATCAACVVVVDSFRPTHHSNYPCPTPMADTIGALSDETLTNYQNAVQRLLNFTTYAINDGCSQVPRCDVESKTTKNFIGGKYGSAVSKLEGASKFFTKEDVKSDLKAKLEGSAFTASGEVNTCSSTAPDSVASCVQETCSRCIDATTALREWWVDYTCGSPSATAKCEGTEPACNLKQCLTVNASSIMTASAQLKDNVRTNSIAVLKAKDENKNKSDSTLALEFQTSTKVHIALVSCTEFNASNPDCAYSTKISDLIDATVKSASVFTDSEVQGFVSWRYNVESLNWKPLTSTDAEKFTKSTTEIKIQAWSKCGFAKEFIFIVVLHLNNKIEVCDKFPTMWYQTTTPTTTLLDKTSEVCMFPSSDFAEVTFDYKPNIGLRTGTLEMTISSVVCSLKYSSSTGNATIVNVTSAPYEIIKEFAIDGVRLITTDARTKVDVSCNFTYTRTLDSKKESQVCSRSLIIKDCTPPTISQPCPFQKSCNFTQCAKAGSGLPDIYQACGGNRVYQRLDGSAAYNTTATTCCPSCTGSDYATACKPLRTLPSGSTTDGQLIQRCDAEKKTTTTTSTTTSSSYSPYSAYAMLEAATTGSIGSTAASSALLGASAMVAVVALVVVARRRASAELAVIEEDAYYPLMG